MKKFLTTGIVCLFLSANGFAQNINKISTYNSNSLTPSFKPILDLEDPLHDPTKMIYLKFHLIGNTFDATDFIKSPRQIWRVGTEFFRSEEEIDPWLKLKQLIIISEPDMWIVNPNNKVGLYTFNPDAVVHINVFKDHPELGWDVEFGREIYYFKKNNAKEIKRHNETDYVLENDKTVLILTVNDLNIPKTMTLFKKEDYNKQKNFGDNNIMFSIAYDDYEINLPPDYTLFMLKDDITVVNQKAKKKYLVL